MLYVTYADYNEADDLEYNQCILPVFINAMPCKYMWQECHIKHIMRSIKSIYNETLYIDFIGHDLYGSVLLAHVFGFVPRTKIIRCHQVEAI